MPSRSCTRWFVALAATVGVLVAVVACTGASGGNATLSLVAYSTPKPVYTQLTKQFAKTSEGEGTSWRTSYGPSGDQSRAVVKNLAADYVSFSLQTDMDRLVEDGKVAKDWNAGPHKGIVSRSVVVFVVRKGNPKHIRTWDDIVKPGVKVVTPDPGSSGSARWNIMAGYGAVTQVGGTEAEGVEFLRKLQQHIVASPSSGREATSTFTNGTGDVLLSYENEAIFARQKGQDVDYVVPDATLLIENPGAVTVDASAKARKFLAYIWSRPGQTVFAENGYRPVIDGISVEVKGANDPAHPFPQPPNLFTIDDLGGWPKVAKRFFDKSDGVFTKIQRGK